MAKYGYTVDGIALTSGSTKTLIEIATPATSEATVYQWHVEFDNTSPNALVKVDFQLFSTGSDAASIVTPVRNGGSGGTSACVLKHTATTEGSGAAVTGSGEIHKIAPTSGLIMVYPLGRELCVPVSSFLRMRATSASTVNATVSLFWEE